MFRVIYSNDQKLGIYRVFATVETLEEAKAARQVSGDIVVYEDGSIVCDPEWLWNYEKEGQSGLYGDESYAWRMIKWQMNHPSEPYLLYLRQREVS